MSARWDDAVPSRQRERWLVRVMTLLSLDVTRASAADLGIEEPVLAAAQPDLRRVLSPPFQARLADPSASLPAGQLLGSLDPAVQALARTFYDQVIRYDEAEPNALFCWGVTLMRCAQDDALWGALGLPPGSSEALRKALWASMEWGDVQERLDALLAEPLSAWDRQVAVLGILPPADEVLGIGDRALSGPAKVVRKQGFWRTAAALLRDDGLAALRTRCQAFLETQAELAPSFGQLYDPWLLAHPEITSAAGSKPAEA